MAIYLCTSDMMQNAGYFSWLQPLLENVIAVGEPTTMFIINPSVYNLFHS